MDVASITLRSRRGRERSVDDLTTLFDLCLVVFDARQPSCYRALLPVLERIDEVLSGANCTVGVLLVAGDEDDAERILGPLARRERSSWTPRGTRPPPWA